MKTKAFRHFDQFVEEYGQQYEALDFSTEYPGDAIRLELVMDVLTELRPERILDAGCGTGHPVARILSAGYEAEGFDYAPNMVREAKARVRQAGFSADLIKHDNVEAISEYREQSFDCVLALGLLYYADDVPGAVANVSALLKDEGYLIASFRNELMSLFSLNQYSLDFFLNRLLPIEALKLTFCS